MLSVSDKIENCDKNMILVFQNDLFKCEVLSEKNQEFIRNIMLKNGFTGKSGERLDINIIENDQIKMLSVIGFGQKERFEEDELREILFKELLKEKGKILIYTEEEKLENTKVIAEVLYNVNFDYDELKKEKKDKLEVILYQKEKSEDIEEIIAINDLTNMVRNLVEMPANILTPEKMAEIAQKIGEEYGIEVEVFDDKEIEKRGMNLIMAVGGSSKYKPRFIIMRYLGNKETSDVIGVVGKGITFDAGGLCLKPASSMNEKIDMAGGATVIGAIAAVAKNRLKKNVIGVIPACENIVSSSSYKVGDVIKGLNGNSIEITNTDAEGRLILADALTYIKEYEKVTEIIDVATLTGANVLALGEQVTAVYSNDDKNYMLFEKEAKKHGEKVWRMPLFTHYKDSLKSKVADFKNTGDRKGGANSAAKFLEIFVDGLPWIHLDLSAAYDTGIKWMKKGASGIGTKSIYSYIKNKQ